MDKNTIWAIVLSTIVIVAAAVLQPILFPSSVPSAVRTEQTENSVEENTDETASGFSMTENSFLSEEEDDSSPEKMNEEFVTVTTDVAEIVLTSKGGDIVSYKLMDHYDMDTNTGVQISDSVNDFNRTCAVAFGPADSPVVNDIFEIERIDDYTVLFKKNFTAKNSDGSQKKFTFGKRYSFKPGEYLFKLDVLVHGYDNMTGLDFEGTAYTLRSSPQIGPHYNPKENKYENRQFIAYNGNKSKRIILGSNQFKRYDKSFIWCGIAGKYFTDLLIPTNPENISAGFYSSLVEKDNYANAQAIVERRAFSGTDIQDTYYMYFGPRNEKDLKRYNIAENNGWNFGGERLTECLQSSGWLSWLETILKWVMELIYKIIPNWGATIIVLTVLLKLVMFPLSKKQSLGTLKMQEMQPKVQALQEKYKNDQQKLQAETAKLYQDAGYNPMSGCLPMIFQFLILFAMYNLFNNYFEFRGAMFIPGWIPDLSVGDSIHKFGFSIPLLGNQLRILPIVYVASQLLFGKITQYGGAASGQNNASMKFMTYGMPLIFFFLFYNAPSGLLLYWTVSNIFQMGQQIVINKLMAQKKIEMAASKKLPARKK